jgi:hypothetical protein
LLGCVAQFAGPVEHAESAGEALPDRTPATAPKGSQRKSHGNLGFYPGPIEYWMLITDWRNGSIAILLAIGAFAVGYAFRSASPPADVLPTHPSPAIVGGEIEEGDAGETRPARAVQKTGQ